MTVSLLEVSCNSGGPFGIALPLWLLLPSNFLFLLLIVFFLVQTTNAPDRWLFTFLLAGGLGNFLERVFFGCIVDYVTLPFFPLFNGADILLTGGVFGMMLRIYLQQKKLLS